MLPNYASAIENRGEVYFAQSNFTRAIRDELIAAGRARLHHALPESGWVTCQLSSEADVPGAIALFRLSYERALAAQQERADRADRHDNSPV